MPTPAVQFRPFFREARSSPVVPGSAGAEDLVLLVPAGGIISAGKPPIAPALVSVLEVSLAPEASPVSSGHRVTRRPGIGGSVQGLHWNAGVSVEIEWPVLTTAQWETLRAWLLEDVGLGGEGGSLRAITIEVDGAGVTDSAVDLRLVDVPGDVETLLVRISGSGPGVGGAECLYRFGPVRGVEVG